MARGGSTPPGRRQPPDVGARVVVRRRSDDGSATDVLGALVAVTPDGGLSVRRPPGQVVDVPAADVVAVRALPPGRPPRIAWPDLEALMARGWVPLETQRLGGWRLRAAEGFTSRANSVLPLGDPGCEPAAAVEAAEAFYRERGLAPRFALPAPLAGWDADPLDALLDGRGYAIQTPTVVMVAQTATVCSAADPVGVDVAADPDDGWLALYRYRGQELPPVARAVLSAGPSPAFAAVRAAGRTVAVGRAVVTDTWAGVTAMEVALDHRRAGLGRRVLAALATWAAGRGARGVYLQVAQENGAARELYTRCGFVDHHRYRYRVGPTAD